MNLEQARFIKNLKDNYSISWRRLAERFREQYPEYPIGDSQEDGQWLEDESKRIIKEAVGEAG